jgi:hypothetical protein
MGTKIDVKHSNIAGVVPTTSSINVNEIAFNTADGKAYFKRYSNTGSIAEFIATPHTGSFAISGSTTQRGNVTITGSLALSGSVFFPNLVPSSSVTNVVTINPSTGQLYYTASSAIGGGTGATFPFNGPAVITGSLLVSGSGITVTGSLNAANITGSLFGTSSWANNALTASTADDFIVRGNLTVSGSTTIGDASTDSITLTATTMSIGGGNGILNIDSNTLYVDGVNNRVGIGLTNPGTQLDVSGEIRASSAMYAGVGQYNFIRPNTQNLVFCSGSSNTAIIATLFTSSGNFVFQSPQGATDLGYRIAINGPSTNGALYVSGSSLINGTLSVSSSTDSQVLISLAGGATNGIHFQNAGAGTSRVQMRAYSASVETVRIDPLLGSFINSLTVSGSFTVATGSTEFQVLDTGTKIGNAITDIHTITGSLNISGSITGSLQGTSSFALTASHVLNGGGTINTGSFATTGSNTFIGDQTIVGNVSIGGTGGSSRTLTVTGSLNQGIDNVDATGNNHVEGVSNYTGLIGYNYTVVSSGVLSFTVLSDITSEIGDYIILDDSMDTKIYKVSSSTYNVGVSDYIEIILEGLPSISSGKVGSLTTRQLTGGTEIIGYYNAIHAEGSNTTATGYGAHSSGNSTVAAGRYTYTGGNYTFANDYYQTVIGQFNKLTNGQGAFIIGNGISNTNRSNLLYASGSIVQITGSLTVSGSSTFINIGPAIFSGSIISTGGFTGSFSGSIVGYVANSATSSFVLNSQTSSFTQIATGSVTASVTPTQFSITSGSVTEFSVAGTGVTIGNVTTDTHRVTGSLNITGSSTLVGNQIITGSFTVITGSSIELQVTDTGVKIGNTISDIHTITGSLRVSGSVVDFYPSYSFRVNNTNASASTTTTTYRDAGIQTYNGTSSWTGVTAPTGSTTHSYQWNQVGNLVTLRMNLIYGTAGSSLTAVSMTLPSDCPTPASPTGLTAANDVLSYGSGILSTTRTTIVVTTIAAGAGALRRNSANTGYEIAIVRNSANYQYAYSTIQYFV